MDKRKYYYPYDQVNYCDCCTKCKKLARNCNGQDEDCKNFYDEDGCLMLEDYECKVKKYNCTGICHPCSEQLDLKNNLCGRLS